MLCIIDEFTRECLASRVARKLKAPKGALHIVRYRREYCIATILQEFSVAAEYPQAATDGQTIYVLRPHRVPQ